MSERLSYSPEQNEIEKSTEIKLYGDEIDKAMTEYADSVIRFNEIIASKDNYDSLKSWQINLANIDKTRKNYHDQATRIWLNSDFLNGTYNSSVESTDEKIFVLSQKEKDIKYKKIRKMVSKISQKIYVPILLKKEFNKNDLMKITQKYIDIFNQYKKEGYIKYHDITDIKNESINISENDKTVFGINTDKAIKEYIKSNNYFSRTITRFRPGSKEAKNFIQNADKLKTDNHKEIIKALVADGLLPQINEYEWLEKNWDDKENNKLRQIAETYANYYLKLK